VTRTKFLQLHDACTQLMERYARESSLTLKMLGECKPGPIELGDRSRIHDQRVREYDAFREFQEARRHLFQLFHEGYDAQ
jgi:hypothetical protein